MRVGIQLPEVERVVPWRELVAIVSGGNLDITDLIRYQRMSEEVR